MNDFRSFLVKLHIAENIPANYYNKPLINIRKQNIYCIYAYDKFQLIILYKCIFKCTTFATIILFYRRLDKIIIGLNDKFFHS